MTNRIATKAGAALTAPIAWAAAALDPMLRAWQRLTGQGGMAAFFLLPNMAIFGVFVLLPLVINVFYSMTTGGALFLSEREYVGAAQYARLLDCTDYTDPSTCAEDQFWTAVRNTALFVVIQVAAFVI